MDHQARAEGQVAPLERAISQPVRYGVSLRSDVRLHGRAIIRLDKAMAYLAEVHAEIDEKLNALIDLVDKSIGWNGRQTTCTEGQSLKPGG